MSCLICIIETVKVLQEALFVQDFLLRAPRLYGKFSISDYNRSVCPEAHIVSFCSICHLPVYLEIANAAAFLHVVERSVHCGNRSSFLSNGGSPFQSLVVHHLEPVLARIYLNYRNILRSSINRLKMIIENPKSFGRGILAELDL